jgi:proteasome lid subunit RPN8/RPN11
MDINTGEITIRHAQAGGRARMNLGAPPLLVDSVVVGTFHTHPNPSTEGWEAGPSSTDRTSATFSGVPWLMLDQRAAATDSREAQDFPYEVIWFSRRTNRGRLPATMGRLFQ